MVQYELESSLSFQNAGRTGKLLLEEAAVPRYFQWERGA